MQTRQIPKRLVYLNLSLITLLSLAPPARAMTAGEVIDVMEVDEQTGFIAGAVDMYAHLVSKTGGTPKANCAVQWMFESGKALPEIRAVFKENRDQDAVGLLQILINRHCGDQ